MSYTKLLRPLTIYLKIGIVKNFLFLREIISIILQKLTGQPLSVNDRDVPFEQLTQIIGTLPNNVITRSFWNFFNAKSINLFWDDLPRPVYSTTKPYREADGSFNSLLYPQMGAAKTYYARTINSKRPTMPTLPSIDQLFNVLLTRKVQDKFKPHPRNITCGLFYFATLITHDLFHTDPTNSLKNTTTGYLDLSPLYGNNQQEQNRIRADKGMIKPDSFADMRIAIQPPGVVALLVLFSRNHNKIAKKLADDNENGRFNKFGPNGPTLDYEAIFQTARLVNGACYINIVLHNYLRAILGLPDDTAYTLDALTPSLKEDSSSGNQVAVEFNMIYRWHSTIGEKDAEWIEQIVPDAMKYFYALSQKPAPKDGKAECTPEEYEKCNREKMVTFVGDTLKNGKLRKGKTALEAWEPALCVEQGYWLTPSMIRQKDGSFSDDDIYTWLKFGFTEVAAAYGPNQIPDCMREIEKRGIQQARNAGICTLNEFRERFGLKKYKSFADMTPDKRTQNHLKCFYGEIDNVELYPGIVCEQPKDQGLCVNYTISRAILADASNLLRNDRFLCEMRTPKHLTQWGWNLQAGATDEYQYQTYGRCMDEMLTTLVGRKFRPQENVVVSPFQLLNAKK